MDNFDDFPLKEIAKATLNIFIDGTLLSFATVLNFVPQLLVSIFAGHLDGIEFINTATLYLLIDSIFGALSFAYAIGSVIIRLIILHEFINKFYSRNNLINRV